MLTTETMQVYDEMGDGYDEFFLMYSEGEKKYNIIYVDKFYCDMPSSEE